jgi:cathepsin B
MCRTGIVSDACYPYTSGKGASGDCSKTCTGTGKWAPNYATKHHTYTTVAEIKQEIFTNGPIQAGFTVYEDFMSYKSGVYKHTTGKALGGHAIKIVGWDSTADGVGYWIVANSWNSDWGLDGFFWFEQNQENSDMESQGIAGKADLDGSFQFLCYL